MKRMTAAAALLALSAPFAYAQDAAAPATPPAAPAENAAPMTPAQDGMAPATQAQDSGADAAAPAGTGAMPADTDMAASEGGIIYEGAKGPVLASWAMGKAIWTTEQSSSTDWEGYQDVSERPADWDNIGDIDDILIAADGSVDGYVADIGGFLGIGAKRVLLEPEQLHLMQSGDEFYFATNFTEDELKALPDFNDESTLTN